MILWPLPEFMRLSRLSSQFSGLMLSIQSRSATSPQSTVPPFGTVESASMEMPTMDARSSRSFLLKSRASIFAAILDPGGLVGDPLDVTSDCEHDDEYCKEETGEPRHLLKLLLLLLLWADRTGSIPVRAVAVP